MRIAGVRAGRAASCEMPAALPSRRFRMEPRSAAPAACGGLVRGHLGGCHRHSRAGHALCAGYVFSLAGGVTFLSSLLFVPLRSTSALAATPPPLSRHASRARESASGKRDVRLACVLRAAHDLLSSHSRSPPRLCRVVSFLSCACRFFVALSACLLRAAITVASKPSTLSATRPRSELRQCESPSARARALSSAVCCVCCVWPLRPLATGQLPCRVAGLPGFPLS